ncbi:MAG: endo-1,4-beta-xylanase [Clostridia bacterium]|nr:endo-1,4-beta-xylanase [Clostridia bacterium]
MRDSKQIMELFEQQRAQTDAYVREGIEKNRKGELRIRVTDANGQAVPGAQIHVRQLTHAFRYGCNLFMLDELETDEKNAKYREIMRTFGNMYTLPFYWDATEPERGKTRYHKDSVKVYRRPAIDRCIEFCQENGIELREHALAYERFFPKWMYNLPMDEAWSELERRFQEISARYADKIPTIEVTNEVGHAPGQTALIQHPDYINRCFALAEKYFPHNQLGINEATRWAWDDKCRTCDKYYAYIENAMLKGARIDAIGMQYHMFFRSEDEYERTRPFYDPQNLIRHMDLYARFNKPLQITEVTIPAYTDLPEDEQLQAEIITQLFSIWFAHPAVEQIIYWNMIDGYAHLWDPDPETIRRSQGNMTLGENYYRGGLLRFDMSPKPAYFAIRNLFEKVWHTDEAAATNTDGECMLRGFYGDYEVEITLPDGTRTEKITLAKGTENTLNVII